jgi:hypothetical protein
MLSPLRMPFRHARTAGHLQLRIINQAQRIYTSVSVIGSPVRFWVFGWFLFLLLSHDVYRKCIKVRLDVRRAIFLDSLYAGPAVFGDSATRAQVELAYPSESLAAIRGFGCQTPVHSCSRKKPGPRLAKIGGMGPLQITCSIHPGNINRLRGRPWTDR